MSDQFNFKSEYVFGPSCYNCGRPEYINCEEIDCEEVPIEFFEDKDPFELPRKCGRYLPSKWKCNHCESDIGFGFSHRYWFESYECVVPICKNCFDIVPDEELKAGSVCNC